MLGYSVQSQTQLQRRHTASATYIRGTITYQAAFVVRRCFRKRSTRFSASLRTFFLPHFVPVCFLLQTILCSAFKRRTYFSQFCFHLTFLGCFFFPPYFYINLQLLTRLKRKHKTQHISFSPYHKAAQKATLGLFLLVFFGAFYGSS